MNIRAVLKAPAQLATATQNATVISIVALVIAAVALIAATRHKGA